MTQMRRALIDRLPEYIADRHKQSIDAVFRIADNAAATIKGLKSDPRFTAQYRHKAIEDAVLSGPVAEFAKLRANYDDELAKIRGEKAALAPKEIDRSDTFSEMQRAETRSWLRSLPEDERVRVAMTDPAAKAAIIHAPSVAMTGISPEIRDRLVIEATEAEHGPELARIEKREAAVLAVLSAMGVAKIEFEEAAGVSLPEVRKG